MKNNALVNVAVVAILIIMAGMLTFFYISLNRMDKKMVNLQTTMSENSQKINNVVNFFNSNINGQVDN